MKVLSVQQPWASLLVLGLKWIETRDWYTWCRGELAIHASKAFPKAQRDLVVYDPVFAAAFKRAGVVTWQSLPLGAIVGVVDLWDCVHVEQCGWDEETEREVFVGPEERHFGNYDLSRGDRYAWLTRKPRRVEPVAVSGQLGLWEYNGGALRDLAA